MTMKRLFIVCLAFAIAVLIALLYTDISHGQFAIGVEEILKEEKAEFQPRSRFSTRIKIIHGENTEVEKATNKWLEALENSRAKILKIDSTGYDGYEHSKVMIVY